MIDEDPSPEDIERFDREVAYCPDCGAEVWDQAEVCPKCFAYLGGRTSSREPVQRWVHQRTILLIVLGFLALFAFLWLLTRPAAL